MRTTSARHRDCRMMLGGYLIFQHCVGVCTRVILELSYRIRAVDFLRSKVSEASFLFSSVGRREVKSKEKVYPHPRVSCP